MANKSKTETTAIMEQPTGFAILADNNFAAVISEELSGFEFGFERIKIPSGGATVFEMPTEDNDETESIKEFSGVILCQHPLFTYYSAKYTGANNPPDCGSIDGITGQGSPGGVCKTCPLNQYGTGENGSKACKNRRRIFILREGELFPLILSLPTGSLKAFNKYLKQQLSKGRKPNAVVTRFGLKKATNAGGVIYSQATFALDRVLTSEEQALIETMSDQIKAYSRNIGFEADSAGAAEDDIPAEFNQSEGN